MVEVSKTDIYSIGKTVYDYFKKNKTYPKSVKIRGVEYNILVATHLMAVIVATNKNTVTKVNVGGAKSPTGDRCNRKVIKSVYQDMAKRLIQYIKQNGRLPNYVTIDGKQKCSIILFMLQLSKIVSFMKDNGTYPSNILINSADLQNPTPSPTPQSKCTNPYISKPYNTSSGCDAMGQNTPYYCADSMMQKMLYKFGIKISQSELARVAETTTDGTGHDGINTAIAYVARKHNVKLKVEWKNFSDIGWKGMGELMCQSNKAVGNHVLYRNTWGHYEYPIKVNTSEETITVINSLGDYGCGNCYCGYIEERSFNEHRSYLNGISQKSVLIITKG